MYKFEIPIGDWSDDGHGKCKYFLVESNKSVEEVRELHYRIPEVTGINIENICAEYEESIYSDSTGIEKIKNIGFTSYEDLEEDGIFFEPIQMAELWVYLLKMVDQNLEITFIKADKTPMLPFYGFDEKKRHIGQVGYGLFE